MTIEKATTTWISRQHTISNHGVRKFWIYWTLHLLTVELHGHIWEILIISLVCAFWMNISPTFWKFPSFLQTREEIGGQLLKKLVDLWSISDILGKI